MNDLTKDVTGVLMAIVGVAILFTLVNPRNKTSQVIQSGGNAFATMLGAAMGQNSNGYGPVMGGY